MSEEIRLPEDPPNDEPLRMRPKLTELEALPELLALAALLTLAGPDCL